MKFEFINFQKEKNGSKYRYKIGIDSSFCFSSYYLPKHPAQTAVRPAQEAHPQTQSPK